MLCLQDFFCGSSSHWSGMCVTAAGILPLAARTPIASQLPASFQMQLIVWADPKTAPSGINAAAKGEEMAITSKVYSVITRPGDFPCFPYLISAILVAKPVTVCVGSIPLGSCKPTGSPYAYRYLCKATGLVVLPGYESLVVDRKSTRLNSSH